MPDWTYGDSWEQYPLTLGEPWQEVRTGSTVMVWDLFAGLPEFMRQADLVYADPPWNTGNIRSFYTKAGRPFDRTHREFTDVLFDAIEQIGAPVCYLEIGKQNLQVFVNCMRTIYPVVQSWPVTYYRKNRSYLVRGGQAETAVDFTGVDDMHTPRLAMEAEMFSCVADPCMGQGLTATTAYRLGKRFVGTELNPRRLAVAVDLVAKMGGTWHAVPLST